MKNHVPRKPGRPEPLQHPEKFESQEMSQGPEKSALSEQNLLPEKDAPSEQNLLPEKDARSEQNPLPEKDAHSEQKSHPGQPAPPEQCEPDISPGAHPYESSSIIPYSVLSNLRFLRGFEPMIRAAYEREVASVRLRDGVYLAEADERASADEPKLAALADVLFEHFCCALELLRGDKNRAVANWKNSAKWFPRRYYEQDGKQEMQAVSDVVSDRSQEADAGDEVVPPPDYTEVRRGMNKPKRYCTGDAVPPGDAMPPGVAVPPGDDEVPPGDEEGLISIRGNRPPKSNVLRIKALKFGIRMVLLHKYLIAKKVYDISGQVVRCGTSVGANIHEANAAESLRDFIHKLAISHKELEETIYWLRLLKQGNYLPRGGYRSLRDDADELLRLLSRILFKSRMRLRGTDLRSKS